MLATHRYLDWVLRIATVATEGGYRSDVLIVSVRDPFDRGETLQLADLMPTPADSAANARRVAQFHIEETYGIDKRDMQARYPDFRSESPAD